MSNSSICLFVGHSLLIAYLFYQNKKLNDTLKKIYKKIYYNMNKKSYYSIDYKIPHANIMSTNDKSQVNYQKEVEYLLDDYEYITL
jgi:hypothetical protein